LWRSQQTTRRQTKAKRFVLFERTTDGYVIRKASEHGLGLYRRPVRDPKGWTAPWPYWVEVVWRRIIDEVEGRPLTTAPRWFCRPAVGQVSTTSWNLLSPFVRSAPGHGDRVRPFNFMLVGHADPLAPLPPGVTAGRVTPVAPYSIRAAGYLDLPWRNRVDGQPIAVTTRRGGERGAVRLKTYREVVRDYRWHPERKSGDPDGGIGLRTSRGLLPRRPVVAVGVRHIGKETNRLDEVEEGLVDVSDNIHIQYVDERGEWSAFCRRFSSYGTSEGGNTWHRRRGYLSGQSAMRSMTARCRTERRGPRSSDWRPAPERLERGVRPEGESRDSTLNASRAGSGA